MAVVVVVVLTSTLAQAQVDINYTKGKEYYDRNQYREALYHFRKFIAIDSSKAEVFQWRGNCYLDVNQLDSAESDYKAALKLDPSMNIVRYNLALVYQGQKRNDLALSALRTYCKTNPDDINALTFFSFLMKDVDADSSTLLLTKAYALDSLDQHVLGSLISVGLERHDYATVLKYGLKLRKITPQDNELLDLLAYSSERVGEYEQARVFYDALIVADPTKYRSYIDRTRNELYLQTKSEVWKDGSLRSFRSISSDTTALLDKIVADRNSPYYYTTLLNRFHMQEPLGIDEYFMLYYGFTTDSRYSPYNSSDVDFRHDFQSENFSAIISNAQNLLKKDEFNPQLYEYLAFAQFKSGNTTDALVNLKIYLGIMEAILATGDGSSAHNAFIVISPHHEYQVLQYMDLSSGQQALVQDHGHDFDILTAVLENDAKRQVWFNIDKPFSSLGKMFKDASPDDKKKKKRKKS